ncbi:hypothetical protein RIF29_20625 [Crotalaria pallida]|uniref:Uncharacterized protein n=1 Tax=Crotalaria pallida TaxID=3830 RepID=A0AAN9F1K3_CROPI
MIQNLETTMRSGGVPQAPQFRPSTVTSSHSAAATTVKTSSSTNSSTRGEAQKSSPNVIAGNLLSDAHDNVQDEIIKEFVAIMAIGTMRVSEAAALGTKRVMQRYGHTAVSQN